MRRTDAAWVAAHRAQGVAVVVGRDGVLIDGDAPARVPVGDAPDPILLGVGDDGRALFAADPADGAAASPRCATSRHACRRPTAGSLAHASRPAELAPPPPLLRELRRATESAEAGYSRALPHCGRSTTRAPTRW